MCVALKECFFLRKNILFIRKNINPTHIWIITNKRNFKYLPKENDITLIDEDKLIDGLTFQKVKSIIDNHLHVKNYGWYFQQFLKLGFALSSYAKEEYLVWDSDTVPFNKLNFKKGESDLFLPKTEHNATYFETIDKLFEAPIKANYSFISEHMIFRCSILKEMLNKIEGKHMNKKPWYELCITSVKPYTKNGFSEYETYGTYCINYHPQLLCPRTLRTFRRCSKLYSIFASSKEIQTLAEDLDTGSFEVYDYPVGGFRKYKQIIYNYFCKIVTKKRMIMN